jgi:hypothetical protein
MKLNRALAHLDGAGALRAGDSSRTQGKWNVL